VFLSIAIASVDIGKGKSIKKFLGINSKLRSIAAAICERLSKSAMALGASMSFSSTQELQNF